MDRPNEITTLHVSMQRDMAEKLHAFAAAHGLTTGALLRGFAAAVLTEDGTAEPELPESGWLCRISDGNAKRIRAEYARNNPELLGPDELVNEILSSWFNLMSWTKG